MTPAVQDLEREVERLKRTTVETVAAWQAQKQKNKVREICLVIALIVAGPVIAFEIELVSHLAEEKFRREAIKHNAARWEADANGKAVFRWNDEKPAVEKP